MNSIFCRRLEGESFHDIATSLSMPVLSVMDQHDREMWALFAKITRRLGLAAFYLRDLPGDVVATLAVTTLDELRRIHGAGGGGAIWSMLRRPHFKDGKLRSLASHLANLAAAQPELESHLPVVRAHLDRGSRGRPRRRVTADMASASDA